MQDTGSRTQGRHEAHSPATDDPVLHPFLCAQRKAQRVRKVCAGTGRGGEGDFARKVGLDFTSIPAPGHGRLRILKSKPYVSRSVPGKHYKNDGPMEATS